MVKMCHDWQHQMKAASSHLEEIHDVNTDAIYYCSVDWGAVITN